MAKLINEIDGRPSKNNFKEAKCREIEGPYSREISNVVTEEILSFYVMIMEGQFIRAVKNYGTAI